LKVVASWSGGKDSCFAYYKAPKSGLEVASLLTFMESEERSNFHAITSRLLDVQAQAVGAKLAKQVTVAGSYELQFKEALLKFKAERVEGLVTGDIYEVANHEKGWLERVLGEVGLVPIRPLWQQNTTQIFKDFISAGFKATVVRTKLSALGEEWLGRELNQQFLSDILKLEGVDPCGEGGEYHTVVTDGPIFTNRIKLTETRKSSQGRFGRLDVLRFEVEAKR